MTVSRSEGGRWLIVGAVLSFAAALLHVGCIAFGPEWFRFFGAPEALVSAYEQGDNALIWMTIGITGVLALWGAYALAGAGVIARLPLLRTGLVLITAIYLARGALIVPVAISVPYPEGAFDYWSSMIVLIFGLVYLIGTIRSWRELSALLGR